MDPTLERIYQHERAISTSREEFAETVSTTKRLPAVSIERLTDQLHQRLENYQQIRHLRKKLKKEHKKKGQQQERTFDFTLQVRGQSEIKEYDFVDRYGSELALVLTRLKGELS